MDDKTLQALTVLATKLGTTTEYLWNVLVRQAPITGVLDLAVMTAWAVSAALVIRLVHRKTKAPPATRENPCPCAEWTAEGALSAWVGAIVFTAVVVLVIGSGLSEAAAAIVNPEYWALKQILKLL